MSSIAEEAVDHDAGSPTPGRRCDVIAHVVDRPSLRCLIAADLLDGGGLEEMLALMARRLPYHGVRTTVIYARDHPSIPSGARLADRLRADGVDVTRVSVGDCSGVMEKAEPDVINSHRAPDWMLDAAERHGIPVVESVHWSPFNSASNEREGQWRRLNRIDGFIAVSDLVRQHCLAYYCSLASERVIAIPNAVDPQRIAGVDRVKARKALGLQDEFLFVCLARQTVQKNLFGLVAAFASVATVFPSVHLLIAGAVSDPLYHQQVRRQRDRLSCRERVHLRGHCDQPQVILAAADAFVLDSFSEGWPVAPMEALCSGLPVVMSEVPGARELVGDNGKRGYLVPNPIGDPADVNEVTMRAARYAPQANRDALANAMVAVVNDRGKWAASREQLRVDALARFDADACLRAYAHALARVARGEPISPLSGVEEWPDLSVS